MTEESPARGDSWYYRGHSELPHERCSHCNHETTDTIKAGISDNDYTTGSYRCDPETSLLIVISQVEYSSEIDDSDEGSSDDVD